MQKKPYVSMSLSALLLGTALMFSPTVAQAAPPDLTSAGAIAALKSNPAYSSRPYSETYNLGATGLRGWIYIDSNNAGQQGLITAPSRQILVTVASTPGSSVLAVDDLILGAIAANSGVVPLFTSDCRKAFGVAIGDAEKTGAGTLRVKRWRAGTTTDVNIPMTVMGNYTATAPYTCPKSALILANARTKFVNQLLADSNFLNNGYGGAIKGLALLASVAPGDANYAAVQTRLQTYARSLTPANLTLNGCDTWNWSYIGIFLSEYYLRSVADGVPDASVLSGINKYTVALARGQSKYGTFGHGGAEQKADGSLHGSISWYGPVNAAGTPANIAIVMGKKVLVASGGAVDSEIDPAITRGSNFLAYYVNKGPIPYGEHEPFADAHASNGKDPMCAVLFGLQASRPLETEYFTRMSVAGCTGREYGHTGQGFSYLWGAMGSNMGGPTALAKYLENVRWHHDLVRRTDGSFTYEGKEQYGGGETADGSYLGATGYHDISPTATYILTYALPLKRLFITGRNAIPANTLSAVKVTNAIAAATFKQDVVGYTVPQLMTAMSEYDPVVRLYVANELAARPLTTTDVNTLITLITNGTMSSDANVRMSACQTLGLRQTTAALPALGQRLSDSDLWVRGQAAKALKNFGGAASPQLTPMLAAFTANATDPNVIVWTDPIQISNGYLADTLFRSLSGYTIAAAKSLLYPALRAGLKQPDGFARAYLGDFIEYQLTLADVQAVASGIVQAAAERSPANQMGADFIRTAALKTLGKFKIEEGIPLCLQFREQTWHGDDWVSFDLLQNTYRGAARDALPTLYKWQAHLPQFAADGAIGPIGDRLANITSKIASTIAAIENDNAPPTLTYFKSLTATATPAAVAFPAATTTLSAAMSDLDGGVQNVIWSKQSGPGTVTFSPSGLTANPTCSATFSAPGTYVLRARSVDRSILDYNRWITYSLGYFDFRTYDEILGAVTKDVTVTVDQGPNGVPVTSGLVLRMDASQITGAADGAQLNTWTDTSGAANNAVRQGGSSTGYPKYVASGINGKPVVRFNSANGNTGDYLRFNRISTIRSVFWVLKDTGAGNRFLLGDDSTYHFHRGYGANAGKLWEGQYASANILNGTTKLMGSAVNGTTTTLPSGSFQLVSLVTSGNVQANQITQDRIYNGSWEGDIAEILIYDRALTTEEEDQVGSFLSFKYGLQTSYKALPVTSGLVLRMDASKITGTADGAQLNTWTDTSGAANNAVRQSGSSTGYPKYVASGINGKPVVRFNSANGNTGDYLRFNRISTIRSVFWVLKDTGTGGRFLLGDDSTYHFHRGYGANAGKLWEGQYASANILNGTTKLMGSAVNGTTTTLPSGSFQLVSLVTSGNVQANQITQDRIYNGSWQGDIAEILIYNRALTASEEIAVGSYLGTKYGLATNYSASAMATAAPMTSAALMAAVQSAPVFTANPTIMGAARESVAYTAQTLAGKATDVDAGDTLTYSKVSGPAWLTVASSGALSGTPPAGSAGLNSFVVRVTDSFSAHADAGLQITVTGLPAPWMIGSIGSGMLTGSISHRAGTFSQSGSGALGTISDKLSFSYQTLSGDGGITAKISALQDTGALSRVGVMIRETLATNSKYVFMGMSGSNNYCTTNRTSTGGIATSVNSGTGTVPNTWVKLERVGNVVTAYKSTDGTTWTSAGSTTVTMAANCYIGLAVSSGSDTTLNSSQFSNLSVTP